MTSPLSTLSIKNTKPLGQEEPSPVKVTQKVAPPTDFQGTVSQWEFESESDPTPPRRFFASLKAKMKRRFNDFDGNWLDTVLPQQILDQLSLSSDHIHSTIGIQTRVADVQDD
ncbi:hypothetical protein BLNAU_19980 [Blattamonas nauphoetae]|uniref:Uncharacterized protein n=1 Tax=Blattamonas nauphoetae TaxID=2049346 RepID=A0ABQ9X060_9EUKA|nr:hypothetical protein BLNAU_19980 [Blattamonas nauphoetae]